MIGVLPGASVIVTASGSGERRASGSGTVIQFDSSSFGIGLPMTRTVSEARGRYARAFLMNTYLVGWVDGITMSTLRLWFSACVAAMSTSEIEYGVAFWESRIHNVDPTKA